MHKPHSGVVNYKFRVTVNGVLSYWCVVVRYETIAQLVIFCILYQRLNDKLPTRTENIFFNFNSFPVWVNDLNCTWTSYYRIRVNDSLLSPSYLHYIVLIWILLDRWSEWLFCIYTNDFRTTKTQTYSVHCIV